MAGLATAWHGQARPGLVGRGEDLRSRGEVWRADAPLGMAGWGNVG
jgi:hypothetical protein